MLIFGSEIRSRRVSARFGTKYKTGFQAGIEKQQHQLTSFLSFKTKTSEMKRSLSPISSHYIDNESTSKHPKLSVENGPDNQVKTEIESGDEVNKIKEDSDSDSDIIELDPPDPQALGIEKLVEIRHKIRYLQNGFKRSKQSFEGNEIRKTDNQL